MVNVRPIGSGNRKSIVPGFRFHSNRNSQLHHCLLSSCLDEQISAVKVVKLFIIDFLPLGTNKRVLLLCETFQPSQTFAS
jgi:hypothetical protein